MNRTSALEFQSISKAYGSFLANDGVSFSIGAGTFHGIVGENGAGKSTLMKMLYGMERPTGGEILIKGIPQSFSSPQSAIRQGIGMVHQHFHLVGSLPAWKNVLLGEETVLLKKDEVLSRLTALAADSGISVPLDTAVDNLCVGERQQVELLKLLFRDSQILILDEPTAVLTHQEVDKLLERLALLKARGKTILFVTHKLREILQFTDAVTVLRHGRVTLNGKTSEMDQESLAEAIIGKKRSLPIRPHVTPSVDSVLEIRDGSLVSVDSSVGRPLLNHLSLKVHKGEILGIAGVEGNGQQELVEIVTGIRSLTSGDCLLSGLNLKRHKGEHARLPQVAVIPPDRHNEGMVLDFSVWENTLLGQQRSPEFRRGIWLVREKAEAHAKAIIADYDVRPTDPEIPIRSLSGGNQQKLLLGRELSLGRPLVVAAHPTRGVDIGAMDAIHQRLLALKETGAGVLLISSELDELLLLSDRILVLYRGAVQGETTRENADERGLCRWMMGGQ